MVRIELVEVNLTACCLRSHTFQQYVSQKCISGLHMMPQGFRMICLMMYVQPNVSSFRKKLKTFLQKHTHPSFLVLPRSDPCDVSDLMFMDLCFLVLCALMSVNRW